MLIRSAVFVSVVASCALMRAELSEEALERCYLAGDEEAKYLRRREMNAIQNTQSIDRFAAGLEIQQRMKQSMKQQMDAQPMRPIRGKKKFKSIAEISKKKQEDANGEVVMDEKSEEADRIHQENINEKIREMSNKPIVWTNPIVRLFNCEPGQIGVINQTGYYGAIRTRRKELKIVAVIGTSECIAGVGDFRFYVKGMDTTSFIDGLTFTIKRPCIVEEPSNHAGESIPTLRQVTEVEEKQLLDYVAMRQTKTGGDPVEK